MSFSGIGHITFTPDDGAGSNVRVSPKLFKQSFWDSLRLCCEFNSFLWGTTRTELLKKVFECDKLRCPKIIIEIFLTISQGSWGNEKDVILQSEHLVQRFDQINKNQHKEMHQSFGCISSFPVFTWFEMWLIFNISLKSGFILNDEKQCRGGPPHIHPSLILTEDRGPTSLWQDEEQPFLSRLVVKT